MGRVKRVAKGSSGRVILRLSRGVTKTSTSKSSQVCTPEIASVPASPTPLVLEDLNHSKLNNLDKRTITLAATSTYIQLAAAVQISHQFIPVVIVDVRIYKQNSAAVKAQALYKLKPINVTADLLKEFSDSDLVQPITASRLSDMIAAGTLYDKGAELKPFEVVISVLPINFY